MDITKEEFEEKLNDYKKHLNNMLDESKKLEDEIKISLELLEYEE